MTGDGLIAKLSEKKLKNAPLDLGALEGFKKIKNWKSLVFVFLTNNIKFISGPTLIKVNFLFFTKKVRILPFVKKEGIQLNMFLND